MGRPRKHPEQGLPPRVYLRHGTFYYAHRDTGRWENLGRDLAAAKKRAEHYNDPTGLYGTMSWFLDQFLIECAARVAGGDLAPRTLSDYTKDMVPLKAYFGHMLPSEIRPAHVAEYLDIGAKNERAVRANRERACLSSCIGWMLRSDQGGIVTNPCVRAAGVVRNPESARERYVTHEEYRAVYDRAPAPVRLMMELTYRTLQRPESDIVLWTGAIVRQKAGSRVLTFRQHKTGRQIDIAVDGRLAELIDQACGEHPNIHQPIVHRLDGEAYTYSGLNTMLHRVIQLVRKQVPALRRMESFGFRDLKGKGATDMWLAGEPIERIQLLCGHATKTTTERYIKARWRETAAPNMVNTSAKAGQ